MNHRFRSKSRWKIAMCFAQNALVGRCPIGSPCVAQLKAGSEPQNGANAQSEQPVKGSIQDPSTKLRRRLPPKIVR
jgi:hypothetical protein